MTAEPHTTPTGVGVLEHLQFIPSNDGGYVIVDTELGGEVRVPAHLVAGALTAQEDYLPEPARTVDDDFTADLTGAMSDPNITVHTSRPEHAMRISGAPELIDERTGRPVSEDELAQRRAAANGHAQTRFPAGPSNDPANLFDPPPTHEVLTGGPVHPAAEHQLPADRVMELVAGLEHAASAVLAACAAYKAGPR